MRLVETERMVETERLVRIGAQIRSVRIDLGIEQEELARRASVSRGAVHGLECGTGSSLRTLIKVARVLELEDWLGDITEDERMPGPLEQLAAQQKHEREVRMRVNHSRQ